MKNLYAALAAIQNTGLVVVKERKNNALNSAYANFADIMEALRPMLVKHGLLISFINGNMRESCGSWTVAITIRVVHIESGEADERSADVPVPDKALSNSGREILNFPQRYGIGVAYGQRYLLVGYFAIATGDDDDAQRARQSLQERSADSPPQVSNNAHWSTLCGDGWKNLESPSGWGTLGEHDLKGLLALWEKHPTHPGLLAWAADRFYDSLEGLGLYWDDFRKKAGGDWPENFNDCTPAQIRQAGVTAKSMRGAQP